ncbi:NAD(P)H-hydrate dehydratase [Acidobacteriota bacterium]
MKILDSAQMRAADDFSINKLKIPSLVLMENAGFSVFMGMIREFDDLAQRMTVVLCGKGNNGGDGFVVARHLANRHYPVRTVLLARGEDLKGDARINYEALKNTGFEIEEFPDEASYDRLLDSLDPSMIIVDAILGTGLSTPVRGYLGKVIDGLNELPNDVVGVDLPSGLCADTGEVIGSAVACRLTVTFAALKRCHILMPATALCGKVMVSNISIPDAVLNRPENYLELVEEESIADMFPARHPDAHKGEFGHALICAGSVGKTGAAVLAGTAALRAGAGLVTIAVPARCLPVVAASRPEFMTEPLADTEKGTISAEAADSLDALSRGKTALALGPGMTTDDETVRFTREAVKRCILPMVIDADGLNAFAGHADELCGSEDRPVIITPHPGEMSRLNGIPVGEILKDRVGVARAFATEHKVITVLKGMRTVIALPDGRVFINPTGNAGMASGGTGDVLTGLIAAMLAQGINPADASIAAVFLHGRAGDVAVRAVGEESLCAGDLIDALPEAFSTLGEHQEPETGL